MTEYRKIRTELLAENSGQIEGLPKNPRQWTRTELDALKKSIGETPELLDARGCIVVRDADRYVVLGGNMRLAACRDLGMEEVPCCVLPEGTPADKLKEIVIKDNGSFGAWDFDMLANEWDSLPLADWGVEMPSGWQDGSQVQEEMNEKATDDGFSEDKEDIPERCSLGDIWKLGSHRLMCGDSTSASDVKSLMGGVEADMMLTDPPYNVNVELGKGLKIMNDNMKDEDFRKFLNSAMRNAADALRPGGAFYVWYSHSEEIAFRSSLVETGCLDVRQTLVWNKSCFTLGRSDYKWKHEPCLYGWKSGAAHWFRAEFNHATVIEDSADIDKMKKEELKDMLKQIMSRPVAVDVIDAKKPVRADLHPTSKPLELCGQLIHNSSRTGQTVLDLFGGSGSTMMACEQLGRKCYTMEFDPHYCDVILMRWEKLTGRTAEKLN